MGLEAAAVEEGAREATAAALTEVGLLEVVEMVNAMVAAEMVVAMVAVAMVPQPLQS